MIFFFWVINLMIFLFSPPVWNFSLSHSLASRYDESPSHPNLRVGRTHRTPQGQRQSQALPGIWGEWAKGSKVKDSSEYWFLSLEVDTRVSCFPPERCFLLFILFSICRQSVAGIVCAIMKYQLLSVFFFPKIQIYWQPQPGNAGWLSFLIISNFPLRVVATFEPPNVIYSDC